MTSSTAALTPALTLTDFENLYQEIVAGSQDNNSAMYGRLKMLEKKYYKYLSQPVTAGERTNLAQSLEQAYPSSGSTFHAIVQDIKTGGTRFRDLLAAADREEFLENLSNIKDHGPTPSLQLDLMPIEIKSGKTNTNPLIIESQVASMFQQGKILFEQKKWIESCNQFIPCILLAQQENNLLLESTTENTIKESNSVFRSSALNYAIDAFNNKGLELWAQKDFANAIKHYNDAIQIATISNLDHLKLKTQNLIITGFAEQANQCVAEEKWEEAADWYQKAVAAEGISEESKQIALKNIAFVLKNQADIYAEKGEWKKAASLYQQSATAAIGTHEVIRTDALQGFAIMLCMQSDIYQSQRNWEEACNCLELSLEVIEQVTTKDSCVWKEEILTALSKSLHHHSEQLELAGKQEESNACLKRVIEIGIELNNRETIAEYSLFALFRLGQRLSVEKGKLQEACDYFENAMQLWNQLKVINPEKFMRYIPLYNEHASVLIKIGRIYLVEDCLEEAYDFYARGLKLAEQTNNIELINGIKREFAAWTKVAAIPLAFQSAASSRLNVGLILPADSPIRARFDQTTSLASKTTTSAIEPSYTPKK